MSSSPKYTLEKTEGVIKNNPVILATLGTQDTRRIHTTQKLKHQTRKN